MPNDALLDALRAEYAPELAAELDALLAELAGGDPGARRTAHRIAGTAGSYGFDAISAVVRRVEDALVAGAVPADEWVAEVSRLRQAL